MKKHLEIYNKDFYLFLEGGFIAIKEMDEDSALKLFNAAKLLQPRNPLVYVGYSYIHLCKLELTKAEELCNKALEYEHDNETAKSLLGVILSMNTNKLSQGEKILQEAASKSDTKEVKDLANAALEFVDKVIKQDSSVHAVQTPKSKRK